MRSVIHIYFRSQDRPTLLRSVLDPSPTGQSDAGQSQDDLHHWHACSVLFDLSFCLIHCRFIFLIAAMNTHTHCLVGHLPKARSRLPLRFAACHLLMFDHKKKAFFPGALRLFFLSPLNEEDRNRLKTLLWDLECLCLHLDISFWLVISVGWCRTESKSKCEHV